ncbi:site-specific DNA-methyltransferase [Staphylococcus equorum]|uniref:site-specific DNA-methyltransferase n=1 Tax=Staphylococcus equorum TaxID=246432 RepID=UPI000D1C80C5|nr:site-specific DNA-methyltransferase [Staphylococcus equorum]PTF12758.1 site-specific DNA-methyltransferase [Staphylococcus equorum]UNP85184.1 site-specific DNA-methyltransferase [Staphylococcus equorum]
MKKVPSSSPDLTNENIKKLKELFPEILTDGEQIDFDKLKTILGEEVEGEKERYSFNWYGKKNAILGAQTPSKGTLRPDKDKSKNFDTTENLYIEGDNLEVLKLLQKSYSNKIKMIYIDPPYNTGKDFVYKDNFRDGVENYLEQTGQTDNEGNKISTNSESNGRYHTDWINMIYPRLKLARNLLTDDGVIFISIDDAEQSRLKSICDEIFGEQNFISNFIWYGGRKNDSKYISNSHEYVLMYFKNSEKIKSNNIVWREKKKGLNEIYSKATELYNKHGELEGSKLLKEWFKQNKNNLDIYSNNHYSNVDQSGPYFKADLSWPGGGGPTYEVKHPITNKNVKKPSRGWLFKEERLKELIKQDRIFFGLTEDNVPTLKKYLNETEYQVLISVIYNDNRGSMKRLRKLMNNKSYFDFPKDENVIKRLLNIVPMEKEDIVLDFFSGSATTAHATIQLNAEDGGNRRFIMVQLPELLDEKSEAYKDGYRTISDIGEERIRRAGELVKQELIEKNAKTGMLADDIVDPEQLDIGFKVLKLDKSNIREWNSDFEDLEDNLFAYEDVFVEGRSELDVVYEIMLKNGLELTYNVNQFQHEGKNVYDIAYGNLFVCLADNIDVSVAQIIVEKRNENGTDTSSVVLKDAGFKNDSDKLNVIELLKDSGYPEENILTI